MNTLVVHRESVLACRRCPTVVGPPVCGPPLESRIYLLGQAPGPREASRGRPFAHTAGQTLFRWFERLGVDEPTFRARVYMAAVLRCFPGKASSGGDRVPRAPEIAACKSWIEAELALLRPELLIPVGRVAIEQALGAAALTDIVGAQKRIEFAGHTLDAIALPHPSGVSAWHKVEPGKTLLARALDAIGSHAAWRRTFERC
jgi:uracil-DNA glycosylase